jgi:hypothetical protein
MVLLSRRERRKRRLGCSDYDDSALSFYACEHHKVLLTITVRFTCAASAGSGGAGGAGGARCSVATRRPLSCRALSAGTTAVPSRADCITFFTTSTTSCTRRV